MSTYHDGQDHFDEQIPYHKRYMGKSFEDGSPVEGLPGPL